MAAASSCIALPLTGAPGGKSSQDPVPGSRQEAGVQFPTPQLIIDKLKYPMKTCPPREGSLSVTPGRINK